MKKSNKTISKKIFSETPKRDQWKMLLRYSYKGNVEKYFKQKNKNVTSECVEWVVNSMLQAEAYFRAFEASPLNISPLILYYGTENLYYSALTLLTGDVKKINHHGMSLENLVGQNKKISDIRLKALKKPGAALQVFSNSFSDNCMLATNEMWSMKEILSSIPDLVVDFEKFFSATELHLIPIQTVRVDGRYFDRILLSEVSGVDFDRTFKKVMDFDRNYVIPQLTNEYVILNRKIDFKESCIRSISGKKFLQVFHEKGGNDLSPSLPMFYFMGLFIIGNLSRYYPLLWGAFSERDDSGEKRVVENFLEICSRHIPNMILNWLENEEMQFTDQYEENVDLSKKYEEDKVKEMIEKIIHEKFKRGPRI